MIGEGLTGRWLLLIGHLVFDDIFNKWVGEVPVLNGEVAGGIECSDFGFSGDAQDAVADPVELFGMFVLSEDLLEEFP